ncbi:MAG: hypothetical protein J6Z38_08310 [Lachnospiraceae bacterium]|nr:hypothetical protein [Lachnospiraceae bacterium]
MVRKLLKYDLKAVFKYLVVIYAIILGTAGFNRLLQVFEQENALWYDIAFRSSVVLLVIGIASLMLLTVILLVYRFQRNLFSNEGYLTFTLPATVHEHLWAKILCALICMASSVAVVLLSVLIATSGEVFAELWSGVRFLFSRLVRAVKPLNMTLYIVEVTVLLILTAIDSVMLLETCITLGQLAKKHRIGLAVGIFFIQYFIFQIVGTLFLIFEAMRDFELFVVLGEAFDKNPIASFHVLFCVIIVIALLLFLLYYFVMHRVMKKHLNLE